LLGHLDVRIQGNFAGPFAAAGNQQYYSFVWFQAQKENKKTENGNRITVIDSMMHKLTYLLTSFRFSIHFVNLIQTLVIGMSCSTILWSNGINVSP
jgi:hypothetical protein